MFITMKKNSILIKILSFLLISTLSYAQNDPLNSPMWEDVKKKFLKNEAYEFDNKHIKIKVPSFADNPLQVPIYVDASYYKDAKKLLIFADLNAIIPLIEMDLYDFKPIVSVNMKIAQGTPLRAAVKDKNGLWHIASREIKSFGGGCSVASNASGLENWESQLGKTKYSVFKKDNISRIKLSVFHPMDTGLFIGNPEFFINKIIIKDKKRILTKIKTYASISENPRFLFESKSDDTSYTIELSDTDGNLFVVKTKD